MFDRIIKKTAVAAILLFGCAAASAQSGTVVYSLPMTSVAITVEAEKEEFIAGPYAQYAQKYLGSPARTENATTHTLKSVIMTPYLEVDPSLRYSVDIPAKGSANFLQMCSQGVVAAADSYTGKSEAWRFPAIAGNDQFAGKDVEGNLTSTTATLYRNVKTEDGFRRVAVDQSQVVEKSAEKKAKETADAIFNLRRKRVEIITGDTDATFSGEALQAAISEIGRLEQEYMSLFYGVTETSVQKMNFDVVPKSGDRNHMYVAFRLSDTQGLLPANDVAGRPIVLKLDVEKPKATAEESGRKSTGAIVYYRIPATATARLLDGEQMLLQTRFPIYQFGETVSFPIGSSILTK